MEPQIGTGITEGFASVLTLWTGGLAFFSCTGCYQCLEVMLKAMVMVKVMMMMSVFLQHLQCSITLKGLCKMRDLSQKLTYEGSHLSSVLKKRKLSSGMLTTLSNDPQFVYEVGRHPRVSKPEQFPVTDTPSCSVLQVMCTPLKKLRRR